jgi:glycosyltransferase involved in cell wall biosynthesis
MGVRVQILMATYNGDRFIRDQLASIASQTHDDWVLWISDDRSTDKTLEHIRAFAQAHPQRLGGILRGPGQGAAANFLSLVTHRSRPAGPIAFADQDDLWHPDHLGRGISHFGAADPLLYAARTEICSADLTARRLGRYVGAPPPLGQVMMENTFSGNTMILNAAAADILRRAGVPNVPFHDWWAHLLLCACGASRVWNPKPALRYRQHGANVLGDAGGIVAAKRRLGLAWRTYGIWIAQNRTALAQAAAQGAPLTQTARSLIHAMENLPTAGMGRAIGARALGLTRRSPTQNAIAQILMALGRV